MSEIATLPGELEELDSEEDILETALEDSADVDDEYRNPFPPEYVVGQLGHRGGGKSALLALFMLNALDAGDTVFTNLPLYPERLGIKNKPLPLDQDHLLKFDPMLQRAVLGVDEIGTWFDRFRAMSTTSILQSKFLELVIRKQGIRLFYTNQSARLPGALVEQTDIVYQGYDVFFCDWARETNIAKGTNFMYFVTDRTGIFGQMNRQWRVTLNHAQKLWPAFESYKVSDPYAWARKTVIKGGEMIKDLDSGEIYNASEEGLREWQKEVEKYSIALRKIIGSYESLGLMELARTHGAVEEVGPTGAPPERLRFSIDRLRKALIKLRGQKRQNAERAYDDLWMRAEEGELAKFTQGQTKIELATPVITETHNEN